MSFDKEFMQGGMVSGRRKREFLEDSYPQEWISEENA